MKAFKIIYYIVVLFIAVIAALLIISVFPITGNYKILVVQSGSMEPTIQTGAIVVVKPMQDYQIGDIITFSNPNDRNESITHRIYDMKINQGVPVYITKGDANEDPDSWEILKKDVIGKMLLTVPFLGYAVDFVKTPLGFALIVIVPAGIIIGDEIRKIYKEIKKPKNV